ncbi:MAG: trigger factor [Fusobacteria bacterium]|jgi:trigger factor|nr:trigger factor [Fusobacteriota bacterium]
MAFAIKDIENSAVEVTVTEQGEKVLKNKKIAINELVGEVEIPGFRKGKVPTETIEKRFKRDIETKVADMFLKELHEEILEKIEPVDYINFKSIKLENDFFELVYTVDVYPKFELNNYKGLEVKKEVAEVSVDALNKELEILIDKNSKLKEVAEGEVAKNGDTANINFEGFIDGVAFQGGKGEGYDLKLGSKSFIDTFEEQIEGHKVNDEFDVNVKFPEEYHSKEYAGKPAVFKVKINSIKTLEKSELNDDFAKDLGYETLDELKNKKMEELKEEEENKSKQIMTDSLLNILKDKTEITVPEAIINREIENRISEFDQQLRSQGLSFDQYAKMNNLSKDKLYADMKPVAINKIKIDLILEKIAEIENIEVSNEDIEDKVEEAAKYYSMEKAQFVDRLKSMKAYDNYVSNVKLNLTQLKAIDIIINNATII